MTNPYDDQDQVEARRAYLAATFGEDVLVGLATDQDQPQHRTADDLAAGSLAARREREREDDLELVQVAATEQDEDEALAAALRVIRRGRGQITAGTMRKAGRALRRRGYHQGSTAERLARMAGQGEGWRPAS